MILKLAKQIIIAIVGFAVLFLGIALLVLPGPGILTIILALAILGVDFVWARKALRKIKKIEKKVERKVVEKIKRK